MYAKEMKAALKLYLDSVAATLNELSELQELAEIHSKVIESNRQINLKLEDAIREVGYLQGQREELFNEYHEATFSGNADKVAEVVAERDRIDTRLEELHQGLEDSRGKLVQVDGFAIAEMLQCVDNAEVGIFFGPRIDGVRMRMSNGAYKSSPPSGLLAELQAGNDQLMAELNAVKTRIREMENWSLYAAREPVTV